MPEHEGEQRLWGHTTGAPRSHQTASRVLRQAREDGGNTVGGFRSKQQLLIAHAVRMMASDVRAPRFRGLWPMTRRCGSEIQRPEGQSPEATGTTTTETRVPVPEVRTVPEAAGAADPPPIIVERPAPQHPEAPGIWPLGIARWRSRIVGLTYQSATHSHTLPPYRRSRRGCRRRASIGPPAS